MGRRRFSLRRFVWGGSVALAAAGVVEVLLQPASERIGHPPGDALGIVLALLTTLPLMAFERWPRAPVFVAAAAVFATVLVGYQTSIPALALVAAPGLTAFMLGGRAAIPACLTCILAVVVAPSLAREAPTMANDVVNVSVVVLATLAGAGARAQQRVVAELSERTRELEELREVETREAVMLERLRIARDVHDVVGHALAAIAVHARVADRRLPRDPTAAAQSLAEVAKLASSALAETRDAVGHLRLDQATAQLRPRPRLDDLDELVESLRASGQVVEFDRDEVPDFLPAAVQAAAFRIVQESLSNVVRHANGCSEARILVRRDGAELCVQVTDDGMAESMSIKPGHGIVGMRERALSLGGSLTAGPRPRSGWQVTARLPIG